MTSKKNLHEKCLLAVSVYALNYINFKLPIPKRPVQIELTVCSIDHRKVLCEYIEKSGKSLGLLSIQIIDSSHQCYKLLMITILHTYDNIFLHVIFRCNVL